MTNISLLYLLLIAFLIKYLVQLSNPTNGISGKTNFYIFFNIAFIITLLSSLYAIAYSLIIKILHIIYFYFIQN